MIRETLQVTAIEGEEAGRQDALRTRLGEGSPPQLARAELSRFAEVLSLTALVALSACTTVQIPLGHYALDDAAARFENPLAIERTAQDLRPDQSHVGRTTMTLFAIASGEVTTATPLQDQVVREVADALGAVGYEVKLVDSADPGIVSEPTMTVSIHEFAFTNYTWLMPYIRTWGDIRLGITLRDASGSIRFDEVFTGSGSSECMDVDCGFTEATRTAMTEVLNQVIATAQSQRFRLAFEPGSAGEAPPAVAAPP